LIPLTNPKCVIYLQHESEVNMDNLMRAILNNREIEEDKMKEKEDEKQDN